jgi:hypothetical protein
MNGTYTQRRRRQMAGGGIMGSNAGSMLVAPTADGSRPRYGWLDDIGDFLGSAKDKIVDDLIPNEIKESPVGAALLGGALVNQFGLIPGMGGDVGDFGKNWLGNLLGGQFGLPEDLNLVIGDQVGLTGIDMSDPEKTAQVLAQGKTWDPNENWTDAIQRGVTGAVGGGLSAIKEGVGGLLPEWMQSLISPSQIGNQEVQWKIPLGIGLAAGELQKRMSAGDVLPQDTTGLDLAGIRAAALQGPEAAKAAGLHFLPPASATTAYADGGRIGYEGGGIMMASAPSLEDSRNEMALQLFGKPIHKLTEEELMIMDEYNQSLMAQGGRIGAQEGGLMDLGGMEKDYRQEGGFVPIGGKEKADDVPARLSKNEFVFTADAVRAAGGGDIDAGAEVMENLMEHLEAGGKVSEDSQGLEGAQAMFANTQRLQNRII